MGPEARTLTINSDPRLRPNSNCHPLKIQLHYNNREWFYPLLSKDSSC